jgi:hypothetical protein
MMSSVSQVIEHYQRECAKRNGYTVSVGSTVVVAPNVTYHHTIFDATRLYFNRGAGKNTPSVSDEELQELIAWQRGNLLSHRKLWSEQGIDVSCLDAATARVEAWNRKRLERSECGSVLGRKSQVKRARSEDDIEQDAALIRQSPVCVAFEEDPQEVISVV